MIPDHIDTNTGQLNIECVAACGREYNPEPVQVSEPGAIVCLLLGLIALKLKRKIKWQHAKKS